MYAQCLKVGGSVYSETFLRTLVINSYCCHVQSPLNPRWSLMLSLSFSVYKTYVYKTVYMPKSTDELPCDWPISHLC